MLNGLHLIVSRWFRNNDFIDALIINELHDFWCVTIFIIWVIQFEVVYFETQSIQLHTKVPHARYLVDDFLFMMIDITEVSIQFTDQYLIKIFVEIIQWGNLLV